MADNEITMHPDDCDFGLAFVDAVLIIGIAIWLITR